MDDYSTEIMKMMAKPMLMLGTSLLGAPGAYSEFQTMMDEIIDNQMDLFWDFMDKAGITEFPTTIDGMIEMAVKMAEAMGSYETDNGSNENVALASTTTNIIEGNDIQYTTGCALVPSGQEVTYDFDVEAEGLHSIMIGLSAQEDKLDSVDAIRIDGTDLVCTGRNEIRYDSEKQYLILELTFSNLNLVNDWNDGNGDTANRENNGINHITLYTNDYILIDWVMVISNINGIRKSLDGSDFITIESGNLVSKGEITIGAVLPDNINDFDGDGISNQYELEAIQGGSTFYDPFVSNYRYAILFGQGIVGSGSWDVGEWFKDEWDRLGWNDCVDWANMLCTSPYDTFNPGFGWDPKDVYLLYYEGVDPNDNPPNLRARAYPGWWENLEYNVNLLPGEVSDFKETIDILIKKAPNNSQIQIVVSGHASDTDFLAVYDDEEEYDLGDYWFGEMNQDIAQLNDGSYDIDTLCVIGCCFYDKDWVDDLFSQLSQCVVVSGVTEHIQAIGYGWQSGVLIQQIVDYLHDRELSLFLHKMFHGLILSCCAMICTTPFLLLYSPLVAVLCELIIGIIHEIYFISTYSTPTIENAVSYASTDLNWGWFAWIIRPRDPSYVNSVGTFYF